MKGKLLLAMVIALGSMAMAADDDGWIQLFNGKDLDGWKAATENTATFSVKDGAIVAQGNRCHLFYIGPFNGADFKDFEYKVDVMTEPGSNGGLYFHTQYQEQGWPSKGFEVQVNNSFKADPRMTGSLYQVQDVMNTSPSKDKVWFTEHIIVQGKHVIVNIDGKKVVDWTEPATPDPKLADRKIDHGTFALQGHDPKSTVYYKNIRVKPLGAGAANAQPAAKGKWVDLFDGKTLAGWKQINGTAKYEVVDGTIKGTTAEGSPNSFLCSEKAYQDFELEFEVKVDTRLNSGVQIRSNSFADYQKNRVHGYQVEIAAAGNSGRIYDEARRGGWVDKTPADPKAKDAAFKDGQWNKYRVLCEGKRIRTWINEIPIADLTDAMTAKGFIGLQVHAFPKTDNPASVQWRNLRIREQAPAKKILQVAFVTGGHDFEEQAFMDIWKSIDGIQVTHLPQKDDSEIFEDISSWPYDVMVLYNMSQNISEKRQNNFKLLVSQGIGLIAMHHNMAAFAGWPEYKNIIGAKFFFKAEGSQPQCVYQHDVDIKVQVADKNHPITQGLYDFVIHDETYKNCWFASDNHVLLTTDEPTSDKTLAWTRTYGRGKVCTMEFGHDGKAYANPNFKKLVAQAIQWAAQ